MAEWKRCSTLTPWGKAQMSRRIAPGIVCYTTAGHGGYHLSPKQNIKVPPAWRAKEGWYEEDCGWSPIVMTFPTLFPEDTYEQAKKMLPSWESWVRRTGIGV